jgi:mRNA interferase MazF
MDVVVPRRFDVHLVGFDPAIGSEIKKTRPAVIVSPDEANRHLRTVVVVALTSAVRGYPTRIRLRFQGRDGEAALDQLRAVDKSRLGKRLGSVSSDVQQRLLAGLLEFFK